MRENVERLSRFMAPPSLTPRGLSLLAGTRVACVVVAALAQGAWGGPPGGALEASAAGGANVSAGAHEALPAVNLDVDQTLVEVGRTRVIAFHVDKAPEAEHSYPAVVADASVLSVTRDAVISKDATIGYVRVIGNREGSTTLSIDGKAMKVTVIPRRLAASVLSPAPEISSPSNGSWVWNGFSASIEWMDEPHHDLAAGGVKLVLSNGTTLEPTLVMDPKEGPLHRAEFTIPAGTAAGVLEMTGVLTDAAGIVSRTQPVRVRVVKPDAKALRIDEAEDWADGPRPDRFRGGKIIVENDPKASGGKFVNNAGSDPAVGVVLNITNETAGWYQVMLVAAADFAGGAMPTVGLFIDGDQQPTTNGRLAASAWHRTPVGVPVRLGPGWHTLTPHFENDFYAEGPQEDRNLRIDRIELVRIDPPGTNATGTGKSIRKLGAGGESGGGDAMMGGGSMSGSASGGAMAGDAMMAGGGAGGTGGAGGSMDAMMMGGSKAGSEEFPPETIDQTPDPDGLSYRFLRVAPVTQFSGETAMGTVEVEARPVWPKPEASAPPMTTLWVNGEAHSSQRSYAPRFWIDPTWLRPGANQIQFTARSEAGFTATSPAQELMFNGQATKRDQRMAFRRFTVSDSVWAGDVHENTDNNQRERRRAGIVAASPLGLNLPGAMTGRYRVYAELRANNGHAGGAIVATLEGGTAPVAVGKITIPGGLELLDLGVVDLAAGGAHRLALAYEPKKDHANSKDPGAWVDSVIVEQIPMMANPVAVDEKNADGKKDGKDAKPAIGLPAVAAVALAYPPTSGEPMSVHMTDAAVATTSSAVALKTAELLVDEKPWGEVMDITRRPGPVVVPVVLRGLAAGKHTVAVRLTDVDGRASTSPAATVMLDTSESADAPLTKYERALRMLDRFAFGPDPAELAAILTMGETPWLRDRLSRVGDDPAEDSAMALAISRLPNQRSEGEVVDRALLQAMVTANPARTRFVLWAQNHFSTWIRKVEPDHKWAEHARFAHLGAAPFTDLLMASATSPTMLYYLDQTNSYAGRLNENYAREIMELHTLGVHGGYTQTDVTNMAKLITGWTAARQGNGDGRNDRETREEDFRYEPVLNDGKAITVIGQPYAAADPSGRYDRVLMALETLADHPSTAHFVCRKIVQHYLAIPAPDNVVDDLAKVFLATHGDMREVLIALSQHPAFWEHTARLAHPLDFAVRIQRLSHDPNAGQVAGYLRRSRVGLFDWPTPDGQPEADSAYTDSNQMIQRWRFARESNSVIAAPVPGHLRYGNGPTDDAWAQQVIDIMAVRLTGKVLSKASNEAAVKLASEMSGNRDERTRELATLIAQLPEANLR